MPLPSPDATLPSPGDTLRLSLKRSGSQFLLLYAGFDAQRIALQLSLPLVPHLHQEPLLDAPALQLVVEGVRLWSIQRHLPPVVHVFKIECFLLDPILPRLFLLGSGHHDGDVAHVGAELHHVQLDAVGQLLVGFLSTHTQIGGTQTHHSSHQVWSLITHTHTHTHTELQTHTLSHTYTGTNTYTLSHTHIHMYKHMHRYKHIHSLTQIQIKHLECIHTVKKSSFTCSHTDLHYIWFFSTKYTRIYIHAHVCTHSKNNCDKSFKLEFEAKMHTVIFILFHTDALLTTPVSAIHWRRLWSSSGCWW